MNCDLRSEREWSDQRNAFLVSHRVIKAELIHRVNNNNGSQVCWLSQESVIVRSCLLTCLGMHTILLNVTNNIIFVMRMPKLSNAVLECCRLGGKSCVHFVYIYIWWRSCVCLHIICVCIHILAIFIHWNRSLWTPCMRLYDAAQQVYKKGWSR